MPKSVCLPNGCAHAAVQVSVQIWPQKTFEIVNHITPIRLMTLPTFSENLQLSEKFQLSVYLIVVYILLQNVHRRKTATALFMPLSTDSATMLGMNWGEFEKWPQFPWSNKLCERVKIWESNFRIFAISFGNQNSNSENYITSPLPPHPSHYFICWRKAWV